MLYLFYLRSEQHHHDLEKHVDGLLLKKRDLGANLKHSKGRDVVNELDKHELAKRGSSPSSSSRRNTTQSSMTTTRSRRTYPC